eukprot:555130-Amorphochlora_amoeboformis.AAC.1
MATPPPMPSSAPPRLPYSPQMPGSSRSKGFKPKGFGAQDPADARKNLSNSLLKRLKERKMKSMTLAAPKLTMGQSRHHRNESAADRAQSAFGYMKAMTLKMKSGKGHGRAPTLLKSRTLTRSMGLAISKAIKDTKAENAPAQVA